MRTGGRDEIGRSWPHPVPVAIPGCARSGTFGRSPAPPGCNAPPTPWQRFVIRSFRLRYDSDPSGSTAASAAYIIGENCLQLSTVDRSHLSDYARCSSVREIHLVGLRQSLVRDCSPVQAKLSSIGPLLKFQMN